MINNNFDVYFDFGYSKIRAGAFSKDDPKNNIYSQKIG